MKICVFDDKKSLSYDRLQRFNYSVGWDSVFNAFSIVWWKCSFVIRAVRYPDLSHKTLMLLRINKECIWGWMQAQVWQNKLTISTDLTPTIHNMHRNAPLMLLCSVYLDHVSRWQLYYDYVAVGRFIYQTIFAYGMIYASNSFAFYLHGATHTHTYTCNLTRSNAPCTRQ